MLWCKYSRVNKKHRGNYVHLKQKQKNKNFIHKHLAQNISNLQEISLNPKVQVYSVNCSVISSQVAIDPEPAKN